MWKGSQRLGLKGKSEKEKNQIILQFPSGYQPFCVLQVLPPAAITSIALHSGWHLVALGTAHGLVLYDFKMEMVTLHKCTLNSNGK